MCQSKAMGMGESTMKTRYDVLDQFLGLDVGHTVHTGDTITVRLSC